MMKLKSKLFILLLLICPSYQYGLYYGLKAFGFLANIQYCEVRGNFSVHEPNTIMDISGHIDKSVKLNGFSVDGKEVYYIPYGIEKSIPTLKVLVITNSKLRKVTQEDLKNYRHLEYLDLSGNDIEILDENLFQHSKNLNGIMLNNNKIYAIHPTAFEGLNNLKFVELQGNICCDKSAKDKRMLPEFMTSLKSTCWTNVSDVTKVVQKNSWEIEGIRAGIAKQKREVDENILNLSANIQKIQSDTENASKMLENIENKINVQTSQINDSMKASNDGLAVVARDISEISQKIKNIETDIKNFKVENNSTAEEVRKDKAKKKNFQDKVNDQLEILTTKLSNMEAHSSKSQDIIKTLSELKNKEQATSTWVFDIQKKTNALEAKLKPLQFMDYFKKIDNIEKATKTTADLCKKIEATVNKNTKDLSSLQTDHQNMSNRVKEIKESLRNLTLLMAKFHQENHEMTSNHSAKIENLQTIAIAKSNIIEYINTILLLTVIAVLIFIAFKSNCKSPCISSQPINSSLSKSTNSTYEIIKDAPSRSTSTMQKIDDLEDDYQTIPGDGLIQQPEEDFYAEIPMNLNENYEEVRNDGADVPEYSVVYKP